MATILQPRTKQLDGDQVLQDCLNSLPPTYKEIVTSIAIEKVPISETAKALHLREIYVRAVFRQTLAAMERFFGRRGLKLPAAFEFQRFEGNGVRRLSA